MSLTSRALLLATLGFTACHHLDAVDVPDASTGPVTCLECLTSDECGANASCAQYAGSDFCGAHCTSAADCDKGELCVASVADDGSEVHVCAPANGTCGDQGCGACADGTVCDVLSGACNTPDDDGGTEVDPGDGGACASYDAPDVASCCTACDPGDPDCQANGCYAGWSCGRDACLCHTLPSACADAGTPDAGSFDAGLPDAGHVDAGVTHPTGVGNDGGYVGHLFFAVMGDTRPPVTNDNAGYPTATITKIYDDIQAMNPRPQFVVATGDYMFAKPGSTNGETQLKKYIAARNHFSGPVFGAMGNHECTGPSTSNCATNITNNMQAYLDHLITPLGRTKPYYAIHVDNTHEKWTAKFLIVACNAWSPAQKTWLQNQLEKPTTYTFVARHEPRGTDAPCGADMDALLANHPYTMLLVGHVHTYSHSGKQLVEGLGGAPVTGSGVHGYATIEQLPNGTFRVTQYSAATGQPVSHYTLTP